MSYGTTEEKILAYNKYNELIKDMTKEQKIEYLEECKWNIEMVDRWQTQEYVNMNAVNTILKELKGVE